MTFLKYKKEEKKVMSENCWHFQTAKKSIEKAPRYVGTPQYYLS